MFKMFKVSTLVALLFSSVAHADMAFEHIKEELWFKGEQALYQPSTYAVGEMQIVELPVPGGEQEALETVGEQIPMELEVALSLWLAQK